MLARMNSWDTVLFYYKVHLLLHTHNVKNNLNIIFVFIVELSDHSCDNVQTTNNESVKLRNK